MAFEPGGYADKLGNRYEGRWVARQLLRLLNEELMYVAIEAVGDDEAGVDLWLTKHDGHRQAQQCKARNASEGNWSVADLNSRGILAAMRRQLDRHGNHEVALVSAVPATVLGDICESARQSVGDAESFFLHQIQSIGEDRRKAFRQLCGYLGLDVEQPNNRAAAYEYLRRTYFLLWPDDQNSRNDLLAWASMLVTGEPEAVAAVLAEYAQNNLRRSITSNEIRQHLTSLGFQPRRLAHDARVGPAVDELQAQFNDSISPGLVAGQLIHREETTTVLDGLKAEGVVVLHGSAGSGKTGVLYELTQTLHQEGHTFIPVRLDRRTPAKTSRLFGQDLGLPESPTWCLESLAGSRMAVLVLDQLDALRWTSAHSANALDVCKSLVREIRNLRDLGKNISVVLACRTFDLEHDPEITNWLKESPCLKCRRVEVKPLPEDAVKKVVEFLGQDFVAMPPRQKHILQSPQHLAMWAEIASTGSVGAFRTGVQLMRQLWDSRYRALDRAGVTAAQADEVIGLLCGYMEREGQVSAPYSLVAARPREVDGLQSHGILQVTAGRISFCHQSYLDFRIATRLLQEVHQGEGSVRSWLGEKSHQSLFRREQLRQVLSLLSEESPRSFLASVREVVGDPSVRFHLKHLALELVGQIEQPDADLRGYLLDLLADEYWREHVIEVVCVRHPQYVEWLAQEGILAQWLDSGDQREVGVACWLLRSVADKSADFVSDLLAPCAARDDEWAKRVLNCLCWDVRDDSERMFNLRLQLARRGVARDLVSWPELVAKHPLRAIQLIEAVASTWCVADFQGGALRAHPARNSRSRLEQWTAEDHRALVAVAHEHPAYVWDQLVIHVQRLTQPADEDDGHVRAWQYDELYVHENHVGIAKGIVELLIEAGRALVSKESSALMSRTRLVQDDRSPIVQFILAEVYAALPGEHADEAIKWLMAVPTRLSLGSGQKEPEWMPAVRLIAAQSPHCSETLFQRLEEWLIHYHDPGERRTAEWCVKGWKEGWYNDFWGRAQHFLLPALCPQRRHPQTVGLIGVLGRKFAGYEDWRFLRGGHIAGGWVGSTLPNRKLERLSDRSWLGIVANKELPTEHGRRSRQVGPDALAESSVRMFSRDLSRLAKRFPERFARLALQFPPNAHPDYVEAILEGMKETQPKEVPDDEKAAWRPANRELIETFLMRLGNTDDRGVARTFCWLIHDRAEEAWSDETIDRLVHYATSHSDPPAGLLNLYPSEQGRDAAKATVQNLVENALNCVRGVGALAVGALLRYHPEWLERLTPCINCLVLDPHPVVRTASVEACLPVLRIDRDQAVSWFCAASKNDLRIPASRAGVYFFNIAIQSHHGALAPIIREMLTSDRDEVAQEGAEEVTARWLLHGMFAEEIDACKMGTVAQRKGVAQVASHFLLDAKYSARCEGILLPLLDDEHPDVRRQAQHAFRDKKVLGLANSQQLVSAYIQSKAFSDDPSFLLWSLKEFPGPITQFAEFILMICEVFASTLRDASRDISTGVAGDAYSIPPILLRLYEQAQDQRDAITLNRCLDAWDLLFENRVGSTGDLIRAIEQ